MSSTTTLSHAMAGRIDSHLRGHVGENRRVVERQTGPVQTSVGGARLLVDTQLPDNLGALEAGARFSDRSWADADAGGTLFVALEGARGGWDFVATVKYGPAGHGFTPGVLLVPEAETLFVGAGTTLLCYSVSSEPKQIWADEADTGFWSWRQFGDRVLMAAELELAAWTTDGRKLWSTFVEPPWTYTVNRSTVELDVMGTACEFDVEAGPDWTRLPWS